MLWTVSPVQQVVVAFINQARNTFYDRVAMRACVMRVYTLDVCTIGGTAISLTTKTYYYHLQ